MLPGNGEHVKCREVRPPCASVDFKFRAHPPDEFRVAVFRRKHTAQKQQMPVCTWFDIGTERLRRCGEHDAELLQPLLRPGQVHAFAGYHLPMCAPPSTCSTSPVTCGASVK